MQKRENNWPSWANIFSVTCWSVTITASKHWPTTTTVQFRHKQNYTWNCWHLTSHPQHVVILFSLQTQRSVLQAFATRLLVTVVVTRKFEPIATVFVLILFADVMGPIILTVVCSLFLFFHYYWHSVVRLNVSCTFGLELVIILFFLIRQLILCTPTIEYRFLSFMPVISNELMSHVWDAV